MKDATPYAAINTVLAEWVEGGAKRMLGGKFVGLRRSTLAELGDVTFRAEC